MMSEITGNPIKVLCQTDGKIIASGRALNSVGGSFEFDGNEGMTIAHLARKIGGGGLQSKFEAFAVSEREQEVFSLYCRRGEFRINLQKLKGVRSQCLVLIELDDLGEGRERRFLLEVGRVTTRLIHDFKNQMGGLKLYAAYLKKRFADQPEGLEITEKIIQGLNTMAEQAALVSRLARRIELNRELTDPGEVIRQTVNDHRMSAEARGIEIRDEVEERIPAVSIDAQQLRAALGSIMARAIDTSPEGGVVNVGLQSQPGGLRIEIGDQGEILSEQQREALFDFLTSERINNTSLNMALARRIIEEHGGQVSVMAGALSGTVVHMKLPI